MARTTEMRLIELMTLSQDISSVIEYLGKNGNFQIKCKNSTETKNTSSEADIDSELSEERVFFANHFSSIAGNASTIASNVFKYS